MPAIDPLRKWRVHRSSGDGDVPVAMMHYTALECTTSSDRGGSDQIFAGSIRCPHQARRPGLGRQVTMAEYRANRVSVTRDSLV